MKKRFLITLLSVCFMAAAGCSLEQPAERSIGETVEVSKETEESVEETREKNTEEAAEKNTEEWSANSLKKGLMTVIDHDKTYNASVSSEEDARKVIASYGEMQRKKYDNPEVKEIEKKIETEFDIAAVTLGEIDIETANDVYKACQYAFNTYPELMGTLTDLTLGNIASNETALTRTIEFVSNHNQIPYVIKREIILNANSFLVREKLLASCKYQEETGFWPKNADISMIVVHELGHHLLDNYIASECGFKGNYVTEDNYNNYMAYIEEQLAYKQSIAKQIMANAYKKWCETNEGTEEEFRESISGYALGKQGDGGISYTETFAEAIADLYANGENAAPASKLIVEEITQK